jgi:hypothetical protein
LREEHRLRVSENRVLRGLFGPMRENVTGGWKQLHNEEIHNLYSSPNVVRMIKNLGIIPLIMLRYVSKEIMYGLG